MFILQILFGQIGGLDGMFNFRPRRPITPVAPPTQATTPAAVVSGYIQLLQNLSISDWSSGSITGAGPTRVDGRTWHPTLTAYIDAARRSGHNTDTLTSINCTLLEFASFRRSILGESYTFNSPQVQNHCSVRAFPQLRDIFEEMFDSPVRTSLLAHRWFGR